MKNRKGITLIALVITIVILIILASIGIYLSLGNNGIFNRAEQARSETIKQTATEKMNLKITNMQIEKYAKEQRMPTLQEFADGLCEDEEIQYVELQSKKVGSLSKIDVGSADSLFTKLKDYPYEFEINSSLQLASIDGVKIANNDTIVIPKDEYTMLTNNANYSVKEQIIGTWIDGKKLYRNIITQDTLVKGTSTSIDISNLNVDTAVRVNLCCKYGTENVTFYGGPTNTASYSVGVSFYPTYIFYSINGSWAYNFTNAKFILEYTKTTDTAK